MEPEDLCYGCGARSVLLDPLSGVLVCDSCGLVKDDSNLESFQPPFDSDGLRIGSFVPDSNSKRPSSGSASAKRENKKQSALVPCFFGTVDQKKLHVAKRVNHITSLLRLPKDKVEDVKHMLSIVTDGEWGMGRWIDVLVGACIYITVRQSRLPLTIVEVAEVVNCGVSDLGRMYNRVLRRMDVKTPGVDPTIFLEWAITSFPAFSKLEKGLARKLAKQARLLLQCAHEWFITTGRHLLPVVAAVLAIVAEANQVNVGFEELSKKLHTPSYTTKARLKEFQEALIGVGQSLPWAKDITLKTVCRHLPFILQYLEIKMKVEKKRLAGDDLKDHHTPRNATEEEDEGGNCMEALALRNEGTTEGLSDQLETRYIDNGIHKDQSSNLEIYTTDRPEQRSCKRVKLHSIDLADDPQESSTQQFFPVDPFDHNGGFGLENETASEGISLPNSKKSLKKQAKWDALPRSFRTHKESRSRRSTKLDAAKKRIMVVRMDMAKKVRAEQLSGCAESDWEACVKLSKDKLKALSRLSNEETIEELDWEDLIIEYLVLRGADERLILDGYYNALFSLPPVQPEQDEVVDRDLQQYFRTESEVAFLKSIFEEQLVIPCLKIKSFSRQSLKLQEVHTKHVN